MSADKFSEIFAGLEEAYGTYEIQKQQVNGKQSGQASVLRSPRTAQTWEGHLSGKGPAIGIIPINADNNCKWGCIDIDQYTGLILLHSLMYLTNAGMPGIAVTVRALSAVISSPTTVPI